MKVRELIEILQKCPQDADVVYYDGVCFAINEVSPENGDGQVVLGCELDPEQYARDYKHDDE